MVRIDGAMVRIDGAVVRIDGAMVQQNKNTPRHVPLLGTMAQDLAPWRPMDGVMHIF